MEVKFDDEDLALLLLCSLPASFSNFRDTILYSRDTLTVAEVYEALTVKEKMRQMVNSEDAAGSSGEALYVRGRTDQKKSNSGGKGKGKNQRGRSKSRGPSDELFCKYCKKTNHVIENCYKLQNKEKRNKEKGKTGGTVLSLEQLSVFSWVMDLVLKHINCGILIHRRHFLVETLCSMNLLCFLRLYLPVLLTRILSLSVCRWSTGGC